MWEGSWLSRKEGYQRYLIPTFPSSFSNLRSTFKLVFLLSSLLFSYKYFRPPSLQLCPSALFKVLSLLHLPFIPSLSITSIPTRSSCFFFFSSTLLISQNICFPLDTNRTPSTSIPPSPHDCTQFPRVAVNVCVCVRVLR